MSRVGLIDLSPFAKFKVVGPDARAFLDYAVAGTVPAAGRTSIAHALTNGARVYAEFTITALDHNRFMVVTGSGAELHDLRHLEQVRANDV
jgi:dimethylglycine dehydrogenase